MKDSLLLYIATSIGIIMLCFYLALGDEKMNRDTATITRLRQDSVQCHKAILEINTAISLANKDTTFKIK